MGMGWNSRQTAVRRCLMRSRSRRVCVIGAAAGVAGLLVTTAAWANADLGHVTYVYEGLWGCAVAAVIVLVEGTVLRLVTRIAWWAAYGTALVANVFSFLLAGGLAGGILRFSDVVVLTVIAIVLEAPVVIVAGWVVRRRSPQTADQAYRRLGWTILAVTAMNLASAPLSPFFSTFCPRV